MDSGTQGHMSHMMMGGDDTTTMSMPGQHGQHSMPMNTCGAEMQMFFHTDIGVYMLFRQLCVTTKGEMAGACVVAAALAVLYEGLKVFRAYLQQRHFDQSSKVGPIQASYTGRQRFCSCNHLIQSLLHAVQTFWGLALMLIFMTFNAWLCISVTIGAGLGYFIFGWIVPSATDRSDHCM